MSPRIYLKGKEHCNWKGGKIARICQYCGKVFKIAPSILKTSKGKYCNPKCMGLDRKDIYSGINNPRYGKRLSIETKKKISETMKRNGVSKKENNPQWKGGKQAAIKRKKNNLKYKLNMRIGSSIRDSLKKGIKADRHWEDLLDYSVEQLKKRLEITMPIGYDWQDFLDAKLHIDHIIPISAFNFDKPEHIDFQNCWALNNLQLLPAHENMVKNNKLIETFQPSLRI